jgi:preprotein translocase subunit SecF
MKRVIRFQRTRYVFFAFSGSLFIIGALFFALRGFNLGVDFKAGVSIQFQIAPASFSLQYTGAEKAEAVLPTGEQAITASGDFIITLTNPQSAIRQEHPFHFGDYETIRDLTDAIAKIPGMTVTAKGVMDVSPSQIVPPVSTADISTAAYTFNVEPKNVAGQKIAITDVRAALAPLDKFDLQTAGSAGNQEFMARVQTNTEDSSFLTTTQSRVRELLGAKFGADQVILKQTDFVGPRVSQALGTQSIWLVLIAVVLILIYMMFRFPPIYAVAAVLALVHDALIMLTYNSVFRIEMDAGTIAAILTILGYSINDTIVIFDRVRENSKLMRGASLELMLDTSVSQTLGRTVITSGATLLTVLSLFFLTTGSMHIFSLNMLVGIIEGSYSTIFIASPIVLEWEKWMDKRRKRREKEKFGIGVVKPKEVEAEPEEEELEAGAPAEEVRPDAVMMAGAQSQDPFAGAAPQSPDQPDAGADASQPGDQKPGQDGQPPQGKILSFPGGQNQGYRHRHKRHKGRHHH